MNPKNDQHETDALSDEQSEQHIFDAIGCLRCFCPKDGLAEFPTCKSYSHRPFPSMPPTPAPGEPTGTPRTEEEFARIVATEEQHIKNGAEYDALRALRRFARTLERELTASRAEVAKLKAAHRALPGSDVWALFHSQAHEVNKALRAEVERLKGELGFQHHRSNRMGDEMTKLLTERDRALAELVEASSIRREIFLAANLEDPTPGAYQPEIAKWIRAKIADLETAHSSIAKTREAGPREISGLALWEIMERVMADLAAAREDARRLTDALIEERAMAIYNGCKHQEGWVPWVVGGNSVKQDDARSVARASLAARPDQGPDSQQKGKV